MALVKVEVVSVPIVWADGVAWFDPGGGVCPVLTRPRQAGDVDVLWLVRGGRCGAGGALLPAPPPALPAGVAGPGRLLGARPLPRLARSRARLARLCEM